LQTSFDTPKWSSSPAATRPRYVEFWKGTPVEDAINAHVASGKPIGGTSAGLAVLAEFAYGCLKDKEDDNDLASTDVLPNPYHERVTRSAIS